MKRPTSFKVGWRTWTIEWWSDKDWKAEEHCDDGDGGYTWNANNVIWVRLTENVPDAVIEENLKSVLMHEVLHAICDTTDVGNAVTYVKGQDAEEVLVGAIAAPLLAVFRDNPTLRKYLLDL